MEHTQDRSSSHRWQVEECRWARNIDDASKSIILALDGGGIRGYVSLLILQELMSAVSEWESKMEAETCQYRLSPSFDPQHLRPRDYFDYIYGTSTGGIIATMLGRLGMTVPQCLEVYRRVGRDVFGRKRLISFLPLVTKYSGRNLERVTKEIIKRHCTAHASCDGSDTFAMGTTDPFSQHQCKTICVTAMRKDTYSRKPHLLRTHTSHLSSTPVPTLEFNKESSRLRIWEVIRATSAAPLYFSPYSAVLDGRQVLFKDGGIWANNPAQVALAEHVLRHSLEPGLLLSIGTGQPERTHNGFSSTVKGGILGSLREKCAVVRDILSNYTSPESTHHSMLIFAKGEASWYKRLNPSSGVGDVRLDEWRGGLWRDPMTGTQRIVAGGKTLTKLEKGTRAYLCQKQGDAVASPMTVIQQVAEKLVRMRRARAS